MVRADSEGIAYALAGDDTVPVRLGFLEVLKEFGLKLSAQDKAGVVKFLEGKLAERPTEPAPADEAWLPYVVFVAGLTRSAVPESASKQAPAGSLGRRASDKRKRVSTAGAAPPKRLSFQPSGSKAGGASASAGRSGTLNSSAHDVSGGVQWGVLPKKKRLTFEDEDDEGGDAAEDEDPVEDDDDEADEEEEELESERAPAPSSSRGASSHSPVTSRGPGKRTQPQLRLQPAKQRRGGREQPAQYDDGQDDVEDDEEEDSARAPPSSQHSWISTKTVVRAPPGWSRMSHPWQPTLPVPERTDRGLVRPLH